MDIRNTNERTASRSGNQKIRGSCGTQAGGVKSRFSRRGLEQRLVISGQGRRAPAGVLAALAPARSASRAAALFLGALAARATSNSDPGCNESPPRSRRLPEPSLPGAGAIPHLHHCRPDRFRIPRAASRARQVAVALLVGLATLFAAAAQAQSVVTLVSNTSLTSASGSSHFGAQRFETGANAGGYTITEVQIQLRTVGSGADTTVKIRENDSDAPGDLVATLTNPVTFTASVLNTFTAPANTTLDASTSYWISVNEGISTRLTFAQGNGDGETGETGWSIDDGRKWRSSESANWNDSTASFIIAIKGTVDSGTSNSAPTFDDGADTTRSFDETIGDATVATAANIGTAVGATDTDDGDTLTYSLEGTDAAKFGIVSTSGQIQTKVGEKYDYEDDDEYEVTVKVDDGNSNTATIAVTIEVDDVDEPPLQPAAPTASFIGSSDTSLQLAWVAPDNAGRTAISQVSYRYRTNGAGSWTRDNVLPMFSGEQVSGLGVAVEYEFQVLFRNADGDGPWSNSLVTSTALRAKPLAPAAPTVTATSGSSTSLDVSWAAPVTPSGQVERLLAHYDLQYKKSVDTAWTDGPQNESGTSASITLLEANVAYDVQVRGQNRNGNGDWSTSGTGSTGTLSSDATLSDLELKIGSTEIDLSPVFSSTTLSYLAFVGNAEDEISFIPTENHSAASVAYLDAGDSALTDADSVADNFQVALDVGENEVKVKVTAENGAEQTYTVKVIRVVAVVLQDRTVDEGDGFIRLNITHDNAHSGGSPNRFELSLVTSDGTAIQGEDYTGVNGQIITFNRGDISKTYTISLAKDAIDEDNEFFTVTATVYSGHAEFSSDTATATIRDDDTAGVTLSKEALLVTEEDANGDAYTVELDSEPVADVTIAMGILTGSQIDASPGSLTFTATDWNTPQTVTVTAVDDSDTTDDSETITHTATSSDAKYTGISIDDMDVTIFDNDGASSTNATLSDLELEDGSGNPIDLVPAFSATGTDYSAILYDADNGITILATRGNSDATIAYLDGSDNTLTDEDTSTEGFQLSLDSGDNTIKLEVTAEDGVTVETYVLDVVYVAGSEPYWATTMTVETSTFSDDSWGYGYADTTDFYGSLGDTTFEYGSTTYTVTNLYVRDEFEASFDFVELEVSPELPRPTTGLILEWAGAVLSLDENRVIVEPGIKYRWRASRGELPSHSPLHPNNVRSTISDGSMAFACLRTTTQACPYGVMGTVNTLAEGMPGITGDAQVGQELTATKGSITDDNGTANADADTSGYEYTYQWIRVDGMTETDITGETSDTYTLVAADQGKRVKVSVSFTDDEDNPEGPLTSDAYPAGAATIVAVGVLAPDPNTLVSNDGQAARTGGAQISDGTSPFLQAQQFTTGNYTDGYTLHAVKVFISGYNAGESVRLSIYSNSGSNLPDSSLYTLSSPTLSTTAEFYTFNAPTGTRLDSAEEYFVVAESTSGTLNVGLTDSDNEDADSATNWEINDVRRKDAGTGSWASDAAAMRIEVTGIAEAASGVSIAADSESILFRHAADSDSDGDIDGNAIFTLTRTGDTTAALTVSVELTQDRPFLPDSKLTQEVTFAANAATATLTVANNEFRSFSQGEIVAGGTLTATVADGVGYDPVAPVSADVAVHILAMVGWEFDEYTVSEADGEFPVKLVARTSAGAPAPTVAFIVSGSSDPIDATSPMDYKAISDVVQFLASDFSLVGDRYRAEKTVTFEVFEDSLFEGDEAYEATLQQSPGGIATVNRNFVKADDTHCGGTTCNSRITIEDNDEPGVTISETELTVVEEDTAGNTYTVVLDTAPSADVVITVSGHAGTDLSVSPVALTFTTTDWETAQTVTVTAADDTDALADSETLTHAATSTDTDYAGIGIGSVIVTVTDNEGVNNGATGTPGISGTAQEGEELEAEPGNIDDDDGIPAIGLFPTGYTFQWVRVDADGTSNRTAITGETGGSYTLAAADVGKKIIVQVSFTDLENNPEGPLDSNPYPPGTDTVAALSDNNAPEFSGGEDQDRSFAETLGDATVATAANIGTAVGASDDDSGDSLVYSLTGTDAAKFSFDTGTGQIMTKVGESYDYEEKTSYAVMVSVNDGTVTVSASVTIYVTDAVETPLAPDAPTVFSTPGSATSLDVGWTAPNNTGRPLISGYDLQYKKTDDSAWIEGPQDESGTSATIAGLVADISYDVQVRAQNADGEGAWSLTGSGSTNAGTAPEVTIAAVSSSITYDTGSGAAFTLSRAGATTAALTVNVNLTQDKPYLSAAERARTVTFAIGDATRNLTISGSDLQLPSSEPIENGTLTATVAAGAGYRAGSPASADVDIVPFMTVRLDAASYTVSEAVGTLTVRVIARTGDGASQPTGIQRISVTTDSGTAQFGQDFTTVNETLTFAAGDFSADGTAWRAEKTVDVAILEDEREEADEVFDFRLNRSPGLDTRVVLVHPDGTTAGSLPRISTVTIEDNDVVLPALSFGSSSYTATEGGTGAVVRVRLMPAASVDVTIALTRTLQGGATAADYDGVPSSVQFDAGETEKTFTVTALSDSEAEEGESLRLGFGGLPAGVLAGTPSTATVALEEYLPTWWVSFDHAEYTATEGGAGAEVKLSLRLSEPPWAPVLDEALTVPLYQPEPLGGATSSDYSGIPASVTFQPGSTKTSFIVTATNDTVDDDGESVLLQFDGILPNNLDVGRGPGKTRVHLKDNDGLKEVTASFGALAYTAVEGGSDATVSVRLDAAPGRQVVIPLTATEEGASSSDYSGVPASVTFGASETVKTFVVTATDDSVDDDLESVTLGFGALPSRVLAGDPSETVVNLTDNDAAEAMLTLDLEVRHSYKVVREVGEGEGYTIHMSLDRKPKNAVTIPLEIEYTGGATAADVTGIPASVTFEAGKRRVTLGLDVVDDTEVDRGEGFDVSFGELPEGVEVGEWSGGPDRQGLAIFKIIDNDANPGLTISDASVREGTSPRPCLNFWVTLDRKVDYEVRVDYQTVDGTALAGQDYIAESGTLVFWPSERTKSKRLCAEVINDSHDEGVETMTMVLSNPEGANLVDATATGRISNSGQMPGAWLARFGRVASDHVIEAVADRWQDGPQASHLTIGGQQVGEYLNWGRLGTAFEDNPATTLGSDPSEYNRRGPVDGGPADGGSADGSLAGRGSAGRGSAGRGFAGGGFAGGGFAGGGFAGGDLADSGPAGLGASPEHSNVSGGRAAQNALLRTLGLGHMGVLANPRDLLMGSSFFYSRPLDEKGQARTGSWLGDWSTWGRTAASRFSGADGKLSLNGEVATAMLGVDSRWDRWFAGLVLSYSEGEGLYSQPHATGGTVDSMLTALHPYVRFELSERTSLWGMLGYGVGELSLTPVRSDTALRTGLTNAMAAFGGRTTLSVRLGQAGRFELAVRSDARLTNTVSDSIEGLVGTAGATSRVRLMLEGSGSMPLAIGGMLKPKLEAGVRYDAGDAETGAGLEIGGGLGYAAGRLGVEITGRALLAHQDAEYKEWGFSGSLAYIPGKDGRGLSMKLGSAWGSTQSGVQSLWTRQDASGLARNAAFEAAQRFQAELGYGIAGRGEASLWVPLIKVQATGGGGQEIRMGVRFTSGPDVEAGLEIGRTENGPGAPEHAVRVGGALRW